MSRSQGLLATLSLGLLCACVCACASPNEVMIAVHTDLSMPEDVDTIAIEVFNDASNATKFLGSFTELGGENPQALLPITLGLVSDEADVPIRIRAYARSGGVTGSVRILREAVTTVPSERVVTLHLPLQYLCDGSGVTDGTGAADAMCGPGLTCVAGRCAPSTVDASVLTDYVAAEVYGGGSGTTSDGECFDVAACFVGATEAVVDVATCTVAVEGEVNVALRTAPVGAKGDGMCVDGVGCLVALDAGVETGFQKGAGQVTLPPGACDKYQADGVTGRVDGVVTVPVREGCPQKTLGLPTCGPWSASGGQ
ncbi:hypothetical protein [Chondromyces apiculatus]|uniref:Lipoprotein n=1 Tax=Chondromyces apiculatus DSM 436 TaxID=1192034 RepID=A0A017SXD4_9BACT|nr:hypothetical protein [Chondromyces apiculatus]EYF01432.1 Hypothetical protein CAP_8265 [Chondromyces apiculatus DSM 436]